MIMEVTARLTMKSLEFDPSMVGFHASSSDKIAFGQNQLQNPLYDASEEADGIATIST